MKMKKILAVMLTILILVSCTALVSNAANGSTEIRKAKSPPVIDGVVNPDEWKDAEIIYLTWDNIIGTWGNLDSKIEIQYYLMWDDVNVYGAAVAINDPTVANKATTDNLTDKRGDGIQIGFDPAYIQTPTAPSIGNADSYLFDFYADFMNEPFWYEFFMYEGENDSNPSPPMPPGTGIEVQGTRGATTWTTEFKIPWQALKDGCELSKGMTIKKDILSFNVAPGMPIGIVFFIMDYDINGDCWRGFNQGGWNPGEWVTYTLSANSAGAEPVIIEEVVVEEAGEESQATTTAPTVTSPTTSDVVIIPVILLAAALLCLISLRRRNRTN
ncbi:MAG: hypothetical protein FWF15_05280 [Oscillospiraceae bacterium]|nr:hypothetical protein [Oscillospiraceae bacterium]